MKHQPSNPSRSSRRAFTLIESVVTMVILSIVMGVAARLFYAASMGYTSAAVRSELHTELSTALDRIVIELRHVRVKAASSPIAADINSTTASSIDWVDVDGISRQVFVSGTDLMYSVSGGTGVVLASTVVSFVVETFDESNAALAASLSGTGTEPIRRVRLTIRGTRGGVTETLRTRVFLRACLADAGS